MAQPILQASQLRVETPNGRVLIEGLNMSLAREKVAIIGRNGSGKSSLLRVLCGEQSPSAGTRSCAVRTRLVPQILGDELGDWVQTLAGAEQSVVGRELTRLGLPALDCQRRLSRGEMRKLALLAASLSDAELLLLDEPAQDLDAQGLSWLLSWLRRWPGGLLLVSHEPVLLNEFEHFFQIAESGCRYLPGTYADLCALSRSESTASQKRYIRNLSRLGKDEEHHAIVRRRRLRKKNGGRVREIDRAPSRAMLNSKRSYAQESQGRRAKLQELRIKASRSFTKATRRALAVDLHLADTVPSLPPDDGLPNLELSSVSLFRGQRQIFGPLSLQVSRERIGVTGPNGAGKTSLLQVMRGALEPTQGKGYRRAARIGSIAQGGLDWMADDSLLSRLSTTSSKPNLDQIAQLLVAHKFPLALAERPLRSLSPGERVRAALLCLFQQEPTPQLLILDEPTFSLDLVGAEALRSAMRAWQGGLIVASHDQGFLDAIDLDDQINL